MTVTRSVAERKMVLLVEWTATDDYGKVFWVQTVEANTQERAGNLFTGGKHRRKMLEAIQKHLAAQVRPADEKLSGVPKTHPESSLENCWQRGDPVGAKQTDPHHQSWGAADRPY